MARLVIRGGAGVSLPEGTGPCVVGRLQSCGLQLKDEPSSSRKHFELERHQSRWFVHDLGSRNGTLLNGTRVNGRAPLIHGDQIRVGETVMDFESAVPTLGAGAVVGGAKIETLVGRSRVGTLYRAKQGGLERPVVVEVVDPDLAADPDFARECQQRARVAGSFEHPSIQAVYDTSATAECFYTIYELCPGEPLDVLMTRVAFDRARSLNLLAQLAGALAHIHAKGKRHGALTAASVIVHGETLKLAGQGETQRLRDHRSDAPLQAAYAAPEEAKGAAGSAASDVYSLGVVAFRLLVGRLPYDGRPKDVVRLHASAEPIALPPELDDDLADLFEALLSKAPPERPSAAEAAEQLSALVDGPRRKKGGRASARRKKGGRGSARQKKTSGRNSSSSARLKKKASGRHGTSSGRLQKKGSGRQPPPPPAKKNLSSSSSSGRLKRSKSSDQLRAMAPSATHAVPDSGGASVLRLILLIVGYVLIGVAASLAVRIGLRALDGA